jgi:hypothetical protein
MGYETVTIFRVSRQGCTPISSGHMGNTSARVLSLLAAAKPLARLYGERLRGLKGAGTRDEMQDYWSERVVEAMGILRAAREKNPRRAT